MGGLCFILGTTIAVGIAFVLLLHSGPEYTTGPESRALFIAMFSAFGFGAIGFIDDFIKVVCKRNLGLRPWQKIAGQLAVTTVMLFALHINGTLTT
ncbi:membrane protein, partial [gut metagenome]